MDFEHVDTDSSEQLPLRATISEAQRQSLILEHYKTVNRIASQMIRRLPSNIDIDDLIGWGTLGLMDAIDRFVDDHGVPFGAYAEIRIRGAMVDGLRQYGVPRAVMKRAKTLDSHRRQLTQKLGRPPNREELAESMGMTLAEYDVFSSSAVIQNMVSGDAPINEEESDTIFSMVPSNSTSPDEEAMNNEAWEMIQSWIEQLPPKEQTAITLHFIKGIQLSDIGKHLDDITESRVSQIIKDATSRLHKYPYKYRRQQLSRAKR